MIMAKQKPPARLLPADYATRLYMLLLSTTQAAMKQSDRLLAKSLGLSSVKFAVMITLLYGGTMSISDLAERTGTTSSSVATLVERLGRQGLAVKETDAKDRRLVNISLTEEGRVLMERAMPVAQIAVTATMAGLGSDDLSNLELTLNKITGNLARLSKEKSVWLVKIPE